MSSHIKVSADSYASSIHDTERDDCDWPALMNFGWTQVEYERAEKVAQRVRDRIEEYEAAAELGWTEASSFVYECADQVAQEIEEEASHA